MYNVSDGSTFGSMEIHVSLRSALLICFADQAILGRYKGEVIRCLIFVLIHYCTVSNTVVY